MELVQKKPRTTAVLKDPDPLVSNEQTTQQSLLMEANNSQHNSRISMDDERLSNCTQERSNPEIVAGIEGLKLDFFILQKQVEENTRLLSIKNTQTQDENVSFAELIDSKKRFETLLSSVSKKDNAIRVGRKVFDV